MSKNYSLEESLKLYEKHLQEDIVPKHTEAFRDLLQKTELGCFCNYDQACHAGTLEDVLKREFPGLETYPKRQCVRVAELRKKGYTDLRHWMSDPTHALVTRHGRIFIGGKIFHYPGSLWGNPFKVKKPEKKKNVPKKVKKQEKKDLF